MKASRWDKLTDAERFWPKVAKGDGCWEWQSALQKNGYGAFKMGEKTERAHRVSWFLTHGRWPNPCALHRCDNRKCVRPDHLFEGSKADNARDMVQKKRRTWARGELAPRVRLTEEIVMQMRAKSRRGETYRSIAAQYGVPKPTAQFAISGRTWKHLPLIADDEEVATE